jgi:hypothetical protein
MTRILSSMRQSFTIGELQQGAIALGRWTIAVHGRTLLDDVTLSRAREGTASGLQVMPLAAIASRLAGGFLAPMDPDALASAVGEVLDNPALADIGDLGPIRKLPGVRRNLAASLESAWDAGYDLANHADRHPRIAALARIEAVVLARLPAAQLRPADLAALAIQWMHLAPIMLGPVEFKGFADLPRCWRSMALALAATVAVTWDVGTMQPPAWLEGSGITIRRTERGVPSVHVSSCASARHEVIEAMRWARSLLASGAARPQDIALAAASTKFFDDYVFSAAEEANLPVHFAHGVSVLHTSHGQTAAALADVLLRGVSQQRVRRLVSRAQAPGTPFATLPARWLSKLPSDAPLGSAYRWRIALAADDKADVAAVMLPVIDVLARGPAAAAEAGELLLRGPARGLWRRALARAPGSALEHELSRLRLPDTADAAASIAWMPAETLAACPRPFVWLMGLNAQAWPRASHDDPLLPRHVLQGFELADVSRSQVDRRSHEAILAGTSVEVAQSFSRREVTGRKLGVSPLVDSWRAVELLRSRIPGHAMSESDRLLARPDEFGATRAALQAASCWRAWVDPRIGEHDGLVPANHPAILRSLDRLQSATSLELLIRNPIAFMWRYALGMDAPEVDEDPVELGPRQFGTLVHEVLERAVDELESASGGLAQAGADEVGSAVSRAVAATGISWEIGHPIPPGLLWNLTLARTEAMVLNALRHPFAALDGQRSYPEVPFAEDGAPGRPRRMPWDPAAAVHVPGTGLRIGGRIDRLDLSADGARARVVDYKTGRHPGDFQLRGGRELQRCLYAYAVRALLAGAEEVEAALLYPSRARWFLGQYLRAAGLSPGDAGATLHRARAGKAEHAGRACRAGCRGGRALQGHT